MRLVQRFRVAGQSRASSLDRSTLWYRRLLASLVSGVQVPSMYLVIELAPCPVYIVAHPRLIPTRNQLIGSVPVADHQRVRRT